MNITQTSLPPLNELTKLLEEVWKKKWVTNNGMMVQALERELAQLLGLEYSDLELILVANGTQALELSLSSLLGQRRAKVLTTPLTFPATVNAIKWMGYDPVFCDVQEGTWNLDPDKIPEGIDAILAVHLFGNPCSRQIELIAEERDIPVIYDAAHAFGVYGLPFGNATCFSFHATKVFNTIEGGAIIAGKMSIDDMKMLRNHGIANEEEFIGIGTNAKMSELHAAVGLLNLEYLEDNIAKRRQIYERYVLELEGQVTFQKPNIDMDLYNYSYMPVLFKDGKERNMIHEKLKTHGMYTRKYFPLNSPWPEDVPIAYDISQRVLCLPIYPEVRAWEVEEICQLTKKYLS